MRCRHCWHHDTENENCRRVGRAAGDARVFRVRGSTRLLAGLGLGRRGKRILAPWPDAAEGRPGLAKPIKPQALVKVKAIGSGSRH